MTATEIVSKLEAIITEIRKLQYGKEVIQVALSTEQLHKAIKEAAHNVARDITIVAELEAKEVKAFVESDAFQEALKARAEPPKPTLQRLNNGWWRVSNPNKQLSTDLLYFVPADETHTGPDGNLYIKVSDAPYLDRQLNGEVEVLPNE